MKQISDDPTFRPARDYSTAREVETARKAVAKLKSNMSAPTTSKCPVAHMFPQVVEEEEMEKDFTVPGRPSNLECPFVTTSRSTPLDDKGKKDPIAAEFHQDSLSARSVDEARSCGRCPIRFLDKHSPEEIAQYFENHKHEIPRSHEICVKRYQQNENSIRKLDAKYGNLVSMIQGLGNKHKPYLPNEHQESADSGNVKSDMVVEKWANHVTDQTDQDQGQDQSLDLDPGHPPEPRQCHFERPLKEIRVGESPTRPWGISVPVDRSIALSASPSQKEPRAPSPKPEVKAQKDAVPTTPLASSHINGKTSTSQSYTSSRKGKRSRSSKIVINGPVFLGYSAEQTAVFLQQIGFGNQS